MRATTTGIVVVSLLGRQRPGRPVGDEHVDLKPHQLHGEGWQAVVLALRRSVFDDEVLAFLVAEVSKPLAQEGENWRVRPRPESKQPDAVSPPRGLRSGGEWRDQGRNGCGQERAAVHF